MTKVVLAGKYPAHTYEKLRELFVQQGVSEDLLSYVDRDTSRFCTGLTVTTFYLAKGLEWL